MLPEKNGKKIEDLSVVVIVREESHKVDKMLQYHPEFKYAGELIVVDSGGGEAFEDGFNCNYEYIELDLSHARKHAINKATKEFTLIVDMDNELPVGYVWQALELLRNWDKLAVVAIDYDTVMGHLGFGTSVWKTKVLQKLYSWNTNNPICECHYMWRLVRKHNYRMETLNMRAKHHKEDKWREIE